jgi:cytochrome c-type biogenesis protein CcmH/NrfF
MTLRPLILFLASGLLGIYGSTPDPPLSEARYLSWSHKLIAPCCWRESLASHRSPAAEQARLELREMVAQSLSDEEIRDAFVAQYGEAVLMTPDGERGRWLFTMPIVFFFIASAIAILALRRMLSKRLLLEPAGGAPQIEVNEDDLEW